MGSVFPDHYCSLDAVVPKNYHSLTEILNALSDDDETKMPDNVTKTPLDCEMPSGIKLADAEGGRLLRCGNFMTNEEAFAILSASKDIALMQVPQVIRATKCSL